MENLTELISNIFVSKKLDKKIKSNKKESTHIDEDMEKAVEKTVDKAVDVDKNASEDYVLSKLQSIKSKKLKSVDNESIEETIKNVKKESITNLKDINMDKNIKKSEETNNLSSIKSSDSLSSLTSQSSNTSNTSNTSNISNTSDISSNTSSSISSNTSERYNTSNTSDKSDTSGTSEKSDTSDKSETSDTSDMSDTSETSDTSEIQVIKDINKIILKTSELCGKNMMIINHEFSKNVEIVSDVLYKLSKMPNVDDIYDKTLYIFAFTDNKKDFRDILLENPHLHFTNFKIKNNLSEYNMDVDANKKQIVIVDFNLVSDIEKLSKFMKDNIQLIVLYNTYNYNVVDIYKSLGKSAILINKKDRLKLLQHRFYSKIIKYICEVDNYLELINDENLDIKLLIIKNKQLRYN